MIIQEEEILKQLKNKKKKKIDSKQKGKTGEYSIINFLNKLTNHNFLRVPNSGAMVGKSNRQKLLKMTKGQVDIFLGDIICPEDTKYRWIIECKNYSFVPIHSLLFKNKKTNQIFDFITQLEYDIQSFSDIKVEKRQHLAFLFLKITRVGEFIIFNKKHWFEVLKDIKLENYLIFKKKSEIESYGDEYLMVEAKEFLTNNKEILF